MPIEEILEMFGRSTMKGSKSTIISALVWIIGILASGAVLTQFNPVLSYIFAGLLGLAVVIVGVMYLGCLKKNDLEPLRTERHSVIRMALQKHGFKGDDLRTIMQAISDRDTIIQPSLPVPPTEDVSS